MPVQRLRMPAPVRPFCIAYALLVLSPLDGVAAMGCRAQAVAPHSPPSVVELYTSEGCSSCPPADRWLSRLPDDGRTLALGFHVNYWDHLGWQDKLALPATTLRQRQWQAALGARYVYTPQVIVNGVDDRDWHDRAAGDLPRPAGTGAPRLSMARHGDRVQVEVGPAAGQLAGYWAVLSEPIHSAVTRGENAGRHLVHGHAVRFYQPVPAWQASTAKRLTLDLDGEPSLSGSRVAFVVTEADGLRPLHALSLRCP